MKKYRYAVVTTILFMLTLPWTFPVYRKPDGTWDVLLILGTVVAFILSFLASRMQRRRGNSQIMRLVVAVSAYFIFQVFTTKADISEAIKGRDVTYVLCNLLLLYLLVQIVYAITFRLTWTADIITIGAFLAGGINYYVIRFRGQPIMPWDLMAIKTAGTVAGQYTIFPTKAIIFAYLIMVLMHQLTVLFGEKQEKRNLRGTLITLSLVVVLTGTYIGVFRDYVEVYFWDLRYSYETYGVLPSFLRYMPYMKYHMPKGYSVEKAERILDDVSLVKADKEQPQAVNVIVIMNESFADFRVYEKEGFVWDYTPYMDSLKENTIKGNLYVPVFGGNTCNTEYEFLTGASMKYVKGVPFLTVFQVGNSVGSLIDMFIANDFRISAFHPFPITNWNRHITYADMGIQEIYDMGVMDLEAEGTLLRQFVGDAADYDFVVQDYERHKGENYFMFNVTMQNHGGYDNFTSKEDLSYCGDFPQAETYLWLIRESDQALAELIEYFKSVEEPTLICFFGDHQPALENSFYEYLYGKPLDSLTPQELQKKYITPFLLWANYDIEEQYIDKMSANYLGAYVAKIANYDLPAYESFQYQLYQEYPVISEFGIYDKKGKYYDADSSIDVEKALLEYQYLQYYRLHDAK